MLSDLAGYLEEGTHRADDDFCRSRAASNIHIRTGNKVVHSRSVRGRNTYVQGLLADWGGIARSYDDEKNH